MQRPFVLNMVGPMNTESLDGPLSLAQALISWADPELIDAIRTETAKVDEAELDRTGRYTLDSILTRRRKPQRGPTLYLGRNPMAEVDRAWRHLFDHMRLKIEQGRILLAGYDNLALSFDGPPTAEQLPARLASDMDFDPAGGAVFVGLHTYTNVTAYRRRTGAPFPVAAHAPPRPPESTEVAVVTCSLPASQTKRRGPGRETYRPLILEALTDRWDAMRSGKEAGKSWSQLARDLHNHLAKKYPERSVEKTLPTAETIRISLKEMYQAEAKRRAV